MTTRTGPLTLEQLHAVLGAAIRAPSVHNSQPWLFRATGEAIEVLADRSRRLPIADPGDRELLIACGAAVFNLRLALLGEGLRGIVALFPDGLDGPVARVAFDGAAHPNPDETALHAAITRRRTNRKPFEDEPVGADTRYALAEAAETERAQLTMIDDPADRARLRKVLLEAHEAQLANPLWVAEFAEWVGRSAAERDGVRLASTGPQPEPQDTWVFRDFGLGHAAVRVPGKDFEAEPLIAALSTFVDDPVAHVQAGLALQRVLLTATSRGLSASFLSQLVEVDSARARLRDLLGDGSYPQVVLRIGFGTPVPPVPRRTVQEVLLDDEPGR